MSRGLSTNNKEFKEVCMISKFYSPTPTTTEQTVTVSLSDSTYLYYPTSIVITNNCSDTVKVKLVDNNETELVAKHPTFFEFFEIEKGMTLTLSDINREDKISFISDTTVTGNLNITALDYSKIRG
jgi:hypothetical protein